MSSSIRRCAIRFGWLGAILVGMGMDLRVSASAEQGLKIPAPETRTLLTRDGLVLRCTFYPGGFVQKSAKEVIRVPGKQVVPVIMLHGWEGQRREFDSMAGVLQRMGFAVMLPDLRGHGESTKGVVARDRMRAADINAMALDVEAARKFLLEKNNSGELNLSLLGVVGSGMGAIVAVNWAALDWSRPQLPSYRPGCDVKALVLLSPPQSVKGATLDKALQYPPVRGLSVMIVAGRGDRTAKSEATAIHKRLERFHGAVQVKSEDKVASQTLWFLTPDTSLGGMELLKSKGLTVSQELVDFLRARLVRRAGDFPWSERTSPLSSK